MNFQFQNYKHNKTKKTIFLVVISVIVIFFFNCKSEQKYSQKATNKIIKKVSRVKKKNIPKKLRKPSEHKVKYLRKSIVLITAYDSNNKKIGTYNGFAFKKQGLITTCRNVIAGSSRVEVTLNKINIPVNGVVAVDALTDIVFLSISNKFQFSDIISDYYDYYNKEKKNDPIFFLSHPSGSNQILNLGYISAIKNIAPFGKVILITSSIPPGSSGSPVFSFFGHIIGVVNSVYLNDRNFNFVIPIKKIIKMKIGKKHRIDNLNKVDWNEFSLFETDFEKGEFFARNKMYKDALTYLEKALLDEEEEEDPQTSDILLNLGICYRETGKLEKSLSILKKLINKDYENIQYHFELGLTYIYLKMTENALIAFDIVLSKDPEYDGINKQLGIFYTKTKDYKKAGYFLEKAAETSFNSESYYYLGIFYVETNQINKAISAIRNASNLEKNNITYILELGSLYYKAGRFEYSIDILTKGAVLEPENGKIQLQLGLTYLAEKNLESAKKKLTLLKELKFDKYANKLYYKIIQYK